MGPSKRWYRTRNSTKMLQKDVHCRNLLNSPALSKSTASKSHPLLPSQNRELEKPGGARHDHDLGLLQMIHVQTAKRAEDSPPWRVQYIGVQNEANTSQHKSRSPSSPRAVHYHRHLILLSSEHRWTCHQKALSSADKSPHTDIASPGMTKTPQADMITLESTRHNFSPTRLTEHATLPKRLPQRGDHRSEPTSCHKPRADSAVAGTKGM